MALFIGIVILCMVSLSHQESCDDENVVAGAQLNQELLGYAAKKFQKKSFLISGYSLIDPLFMLSTAAAGNTLLQLRSALLPFNKKSINQLNCTSAEDGDASYIKASRLYLSADYKVNRLFAEVNKYFGSDVVNINFSNPDVAANKINGWVRNNTDDLIRSVVKSEELPGNIGVVASTLLFKARWESKFSKRTTKVDEFHVSPNKTERIPFMKQDNFYQFGDLVELNAKVLEIPLQGNKSVMKFILPNEPGDLQAVLNKLSKGNYSTDYSGVPTYMSLSLPKFGVETSVELKDFLRSIGVVDIFDHRSELPGLTMSKERVRVTKAIQKTRIEVDEEGVVAAAANAITIGLTSWLKPKPVEFKLDRPFYFEIVYSKKVLFSGVYRGPEL